MDEQRDVEVFETIPWESLEDRTDRRWMAYVIAGGIVLGAVGLSIGRQMSPASDPPPTISSIATLPTVTPTAPPTSMEVGSSPAPPTTWSEADLMALPADAIETAATALAEWYVVDFFTRDDPEGDRSFVEWARAAQLEWETPSSIRVTVLVRRLAAEGDEPYQRLAVESWRVGMELGDDGWSVIPGPVVGEEPALQVDPGVEPASPIEWVDAAGVTWRIRDPSEEAS